MESLDSGHTTVKTENSQPGLDRWQGDPSSGVLLRSTRVATVVGTPWRGQQTLKAGNQIHASKLELTESTNTQTSNERLPASSSTSTSTSIKLPLEL